MKQLAKICIIGSLDRDAEDNGDKNMNSLYFTYETRGTLKSFTLFITFKAITKMNLGDIDKFEIRIWKLAVVVHVLQKTQNLVISRCWLILQNLRPQIKEMYQEL